VLRARTCAGVVKKLVEVGDGVSNIIRAYYLVCTTIIVRVTQLEINVQQCEEEQRKKNFTQ
jgi:hypothetical protein